MLFLLGLLLGTMAGSCVGFMVAALCHVSHEADSWR